MPPILNGSRRLPREVSLAQIPRPSTFDISISESRLWVGVKHEVSGSVPQNAEANGLDYRAILSQSSNRGQSNTRSHILPPVLTVHMVMYTTSIVSTTDSELKHFVWTVLVLSRVHIRYCNENR